MEKEPSNPAMKPDKKQSFATTKSEGKQGLPSVQPDKKQSLSKLNLKKDSVTSSSGTKESNEKSGLEPVEEVNEAAAAAREQFGDRPVEFYEVEEIPPKIYSIKDVKVPTTIEGLNTAIYELGIINLCWPEIKDPVFETRTCFPESYYSNSQKERLLLAYAESFRRQYYFHYHKNPCYRKPLLLQAPNECGLQKMVCTTIRPTKLCYNDTNTWQGLASLVSDYFAYEPLSKPLLHPERIISPYTAIIRRSGNPFEIAHVLVSWLTGADYEAYVVVGCAKRDTCYNILYRTECPDIPDETTVVEEGSVVSEEPRYQLMPLPDFTSKYDKAMEEKASADIQADLDKIEEQRLKAVAEMEQPPEDPLDGYRTHAWVLVMSGVDVEEPFFIEPAEGNGYPLHAPQYQQIDCVYNHENYYVNLQTLKPLVEREEEEAEDEEQLEFRPSLDEDLEKLDEMDEAKKKEYLKQLAKKEKERLKEKRKKEAEEADAARAEAEGIKEHEAREERKREKNKKKDKEGDEEDDGESEVKKKKKNKKVEEVKLEEAEEEEEEEEQIVWENLSHFNYDFSDLSCWEHLLPGEPDSRRVLIGVDVKNKKTAPITEEHLDMPASWVEKLDISVHDYEQRYPGSYKQIRYKKAIVEKYARYSEPTGILKRVTIYEDYATTIPLFTWEYYSNRNDLMYEVRIDHKAKIVRELFDTGRPEHLLIHTYSLEAPAQSIEGHRTMEFKWYSRVDRLEKLVLTPLTFEEYYRNREDRLESRVAEYAKSDTKRQLQKITEVYRRNPDVPANKDVWKRIFHIQDNTIEIQYHYAYNFITNDNRRFIKPNIAESGGKVLFYPDKTTGYVSCPCGEAPRPLDLYYGLCKNMEREDKTTKHLREAEADTNSILATRYKELTEPTLYVSLFHTEKNKDAQRLFFELEQQKREAEERSKEADIDPLQPYVARMFGVSRGLKIPITLKEATILREQCINDFKNKQLARQLLVQERFDKMNAEHKAKRLWYLANQYILTPEKETAYFEKSAELAFRVHALEVLLTRQMDLSLPRYKALEEYLTKHPLLAEYNRLRRYYRSGKESQSILRTL